MALSGGTMVTWLQNTLKLPTPRSRAASTVAAVEGAVVSNPTAKNTTWRSGARSARARASSGEYTIRTSAPPALASCRVESPPGTRSMSPKQHRVTPGVRASAMASSTRPMGMTHTGHPGPWTSSTLSGSSDSMPWR